MTQQTEPDERPTARLATLRRRARRPVPSSLPAPLTSFVGRTHEIAALAERLAETRLLTLTGIGGIGKSRLALEVARFAETATFENVHLVELAAVTEPEGVVAAIASALGVPERGERSLLDGLVASLSRREVLLILDNCEHLAEAAAVLVLELLQRCPALCALATSRIPLDVHGEAVFRVEPLAIPDPDRPSSRAAVARYAAVRLFADRARAARADFRLTDENAADVVQICARLDGIPLAIELAAARVNVLGPRQIVLRLDDRFQLLTGGSRSALPRHRTLRASIDWSCDLLDEQERTLLRRLAVFAGGWTLEAAEAISQTPAPNTLELLSRLVTKSLVLVDHSRGEARFSLLETIREYALGMLREAGEEQALRQRHRAWIVALATRAEDGLWTAEQRAWLELLDRELDNVRAALAWSTDADDPEPGLQIAGRLWRYWEQRGHAVEARRWLGALLACPHPEPGAARARALMADGYFAELAGDLVTSASQATAAIDAARVADDHVVLVSGLLLMAILKGLGGDLAASRALLDEAKDRARSIGWEPGVRMALLNLGVLARISGDEDRAASLLTEGRALSEAAGDRYTEGFYLTNLAHLAVQQGDWATAEARYGEALARWRDLADLHNAATALEGLAWPLAAQGRAERSTRLLGSAERLREIVGTALYPHWLADHERACATAQQALGERAFAASWAAGRSLTPEQAIAEGLASPDSSRSGGRRPTVAVVGPGHARLSRREAEVARLVARGLTNRQIAEQLVLQESTVGNHLQRIYARLELTGRVQLAAWIAEHDEADNRSA